MQVTVSLDDKLLADAMAAAEVQNVQQLIEAGLHALIYRAAARHLIAMGGTMPDLEPPVRRRSEPA